MLAGLQIPLLRPISSVLRRPPTHRVHSAGTKLFVAQFTLSAIAHLDPASHVGHALLYLPAPPAVDICKVPSHAGPVIKCKCPVFTLTVRSYRDPSECSPDCKYLCCDPYQARCDGRRHTAS